MSECSEPGFGSLSTTEHSKKLRGLQSTDRSKKQLWIFFRHSQTGLDRARQASCYRLHSIPGYCLFNELQNSAPDICTNWVGMEQLSTTSLHRLYHWHWFSFQSGRNRRNLHFCHCHLQEFPAVHAENLVIVAFQIIKEGKNLSAGLTSNASPLRSRFRSLCCFSFPLQLWEGRSISPCPSDLPP